MIIKADSISGLASASLALLERIDNITTDEFQQGGERAEREHLREVLRSWYDEQGMTVPDCLRRDDELA